MKHLKLLFALALVTSLLTISCGKQTPASLVLRNGKVVTVDKDFSIQPAVAVQGDKIVFVGSNEAVARFIGNNTEVIELDGKLVLPGLIDAHAHLHSLANQLTNLDITGTTSFQQIIDKVAERVKTAKPGEWITGGRWDQNDWELKKFPIHDELSKVSPDNPVYLNRVDGNSAFVNQKALEIAGINRDTPDPFGGKIIRKENDEPTGVLINRAMNLVNKHIPEDTNQQFRDKFLNAVQNCLEVGLTAVHEAGVGPETIQMYKDLIDKDQLNIRLYAMLGEQSIPELERE